MARAKGGQFSRGSKGGKPPPVPRETKRKERRPSPGYFALRVLRTSFGGPTLAIIDAAYLILRGITGLFR